MNRPVTQPKASIKIEAPDDNQKEAIMSNDPAILLIAGPGSGKTRVLASRLAYLLVSGKCSPTEVLLLSFTKTAATDLITKANKMLVNSVATTNGVTCNTFHGFCKSIIYRYINLTSLSLHKNDFVIVDDSDQIRIMQSLLQCQGQSSSPVECTRLLRQIRYWKELGYSHLNIRKKDLTTLTERQAYNIYPAYQEKLKSLSAVDFGDLLLVTLRLLRKHPHIVRKHQQQLKHILVDEFQDISPAQYEILRILCVSNPGLGESESRIDNHTSQSIPASSNSMASDYLFDSQSQHQPRITTTNNIHVFCAGDDDQSIYTWRGAQVELMKRFRFDFPKSNVMRFDVSYRLSDSLVKVANTLVSSLHGRIAKTLTGNEDKVMHSIVEIKRFLDEDKELAWIANYIQSLAYTQVRDHSVAILARSQAQVKAIMDYLLIRKIPFRSRAYGSFLSSTPSSRDGSPMNLLRLLANPDDDVAFQAALDNDIITGLLSEQDIQQVIMPVLRTVHDRSIRSSTSSSRSISFLDATRECILTGKLEGKYNIALTRFLRKYDSWRNDLQRYYHRGKSAKKIIYDILYPAFHSRWNDELIRFIEQLSNTASEFDSLSDFFSTIRLEGDYVIESAAGSKGQLIGTTKPSSPASDGITLWVMPMQAAKGLEFDEVILPYWVDGSVPRHLNLQEERRLAFVSLTRAREKVLITYANTRMSNQPSSSSTSRSRVVQNQLANRISPSIETLRVSPFITEILNAQDQATSFEDLSTVMRTTVDMKASSSPDILPVVSESSTSASAFHPHLSEYMKTMKQRSGITTGNFESSLTITPSKPTAASTQVIESEQPQHDHMISNSKSMLDNGDKKISTASIMKVKEKSVLPQPLDLTVEVINNLITSRHVSKKELAVLFRARLMDYGIERRSISIEPGRGKRQVRPLSQCTADQLGKHLIYLIDKSEKS